MSRGPAFAALVLTVLATTGPADAQPRVEATIDPPAITVGDPATVTVAVTVDVGAPEPRFPDWSRGWGEAQVLDSSAVESQPEGAGTRYLQRIQLTAFRTGRIDLPPQPIRLGSASDPVATTPGDLRIEVRSVLPPEAEAATPLPPEPPQPLPRPAAALWTIAAFALAITAAAWAVRRAGRAAAAGGVARPDLPPLPELEAALAALAGAAPAPGHARLSTALRRYLGRALGFHAVESTTREVERQLAARRLDAALAARAVRLLREADQVKFARRAASADDLERRRGEALTVASGVEAHLHPAAPETAREGAA